MSREAFLQPEQLLSMSTEIFGKYVRKQGNRLSPDGIYCKVHALQLASSLNKHLPQIKASVGKVQRISFEEDSPEILHRWGGKYNYHYLALGNLGNTLYVYDPFLWFNNPNPIPADRYISMAFLNPEYVVWSQ